MRKKLNITEGIFPMPVLMVATYNEDGSVNVMNAASASHLDMVCLETDIISASCSCVIFLCFLRY